jgi:hypothetical protein
MLNKGSIDWNHGIGTWKPPAPTGSPTPSATTQSTFEADRARDLELTALWYRVVRLTAAQLRAGAAEVLALVAALLASRG